MEYFIEISEEAKVNIEEVLNHYSKISIALKDRFEAELSKSIDLLSKNPLHPRSRTNPFVWLAIFKFQTF